MNININNYLFDKPLTAYNSGFSKWGLGKRDGEIYFVKEFLSSYYPAANSLFSEGTRKNLIRVCEEFERKKIALYKAVYEASDGNLVIIRHFFRVGAKYYIATEAVTDALESNEIFEYPFEDRLRVCCSIAHSIAGLHRRGIVHADIKPDNILIVKKDRLRAKIIDFDCGFFENDSPKLGEELNGDQVYLSPEGCLHMAGERSELTCKMDVFSLGILFHEYLTGAAPDFDAARYQYLCEAVLDDKIPGIARTPDADFTDLIAKMLRKSPKDRPGMDEVFQIFHKILMIKLRREERGETAFSFFRRPGDL